MEFSLFISSSTSMKRYVYIFGLVIVLLLVVILRNSSKWLLGKEEWKKKTWNKIKWQFSRLIHRRVVERSWYYPRIHKTVCHFPPYNYTVIYSLIRYYSRAIYIFFSFISAACPLHFITSLVFLVCFIHAHILIHTFYIADINFYSTDINLY